MDRNRCRATGGRPRPGHPGSPSGRGDGYGLLVSVATVSSREAGAAVRTLLAGHGVRATLAAGAGHHGKRKPRWEVLVFPEAAAGAAAVLISELGD